MTTPKTAPDLVHVPGHLIPKPCPMCKREIVRTPTKAGIVHVDLSTIKPGSVNQHEAGRFFGTAHDCAAHDCAATRRVS